MRSVRLFAASVGFQVPPISLREMLKKFGANSLREAMSAHENQNISRRCGVPDEPIDPIKVRAIGQPSGRWDRPSLTFQINPAGCNLPAGTVTTIISGAFRQWQTASRYFTFTPVAVGTASDITVNFGGKSLNPKFGEPDDVLGSAEKPPAGRVKFDSAETWTNRNLLSTSLHEIGHALGLPHSTSRSSVMYPFDQVWSALDAETVAAIRALYNWSPQKGPLPDRGSSDGPALAVAGVSGLTFSSLQLYMAWKGVGSDSRLFWSRHESGSWTPQREIGGVGSSCGPALTTMLSGGSSSPFYQLFLVWKGISGDQAIWYSTSFDGERWAEQQAVPGAGTSARPSVAHFNGAIWLAWKGVSGDHAIYTSVSLDGKNWETPTPVEGIGTSDGPALAAFGNRLFLVWKGIEDDSRVYYTWIEDQADALWQGQRILAFPAVGDRGIVWVPIGSSHGVSLASLGGRLYAVWKGISKDSGIWFSSFADDEWQGQVKIEGVGTSARPALAVHNGHLWSAWKGRESDSNLFYSSFG